MILRGMLLAAAILVATQARAGDKPVYAVAPDWVKPAPPLDATKLGDDAPQVLILDHQQRLQDGEAWAYIDTAGYIANTQMLGQSGTVSLPWQPDKGDLIVHRAAIIRGAETIDLLAQGQRFTVLRREEKLDERQLNGQLTATMAVEGLRVGDVLRMSFSITRRDAALGGGVETAAQFFPEEMRPKFTRTRLLWPKTDKLRWKVFGSAVTPALSSVGSYQEAEFGALAKQPEMPGDAPPRFRRTPGVEMTSFSDWAEVSRVMAPLYRTDGLIGSGSPIAAEIAKIEARAAVPRERAALALRLVQDEIRYLFRGMDGGNYSPQAPDKTWTLRYGDCKAKTLLLLAMLHAMKIDAEPVLVSSDLGDALPDRLPLPGAFDHVLVRATVDGETLWLDGTGSGTRLADIGDTPAFRHVLPVRAAGAELMGLPIRPSARPDISVLISLDQSAGINLPAPFSASMTMRGPVAEQLHQAQARLPKDQLSAMAAKMISPFISGGQVVSRSIRYDAASGTAVLDTTGVDYPAWSKERGRYRLDVDQTVGNVTFSPDRARSAWKDIPVSTGDPIHVQLQRKIRLPRGGTGFSLEGSQTLPPTLIGTKLERKAGIAGEWLTVEDRTIAVGAEVPVAELPAMRQALTAAKARPLSVVAPVDQPSMWAEIEAAQREKRLGKILAVYAKGIEDASDDRTVLTNRAWFHERVYDRAAAIADLDRAIAIEPGVDDYLWRARLHSSLGQKNKAVADVTEALKLDPGSSGAIQQLAFLRLDRDEHDAAMTLVSERIDAGGKDKADFLSVKADILARQGKIEDALATIDEAIAASPGSAGLLNGRCWLKGTMNVALDTALKDCTKSIELADSAAPALDSRAMVYFRMGRFADARADLDAALDIVPDMPAALYMRGIVRHKMGEAKAGAADMNAARMMAPRIDEDYRRWGVTP